MEVSHMGEAPILISRFILVAIRVIIVLVARQWALLQSADFVSRRTAPTGDIV